MALIIFLKLNKFFEQFLTLIVAKNNYFLTKLLNLKLIHHNKKSLLRF